MRNILYIQFALLFADLVQAVGGVLSLKWIRDGIVQVGMICDAQGQHFSARFCH